MPGLISDPIGNATGLAQGSDAFASTPWEGQDWLGATRMLGREVDRLQAEEGSSPLVAPGDEIPTLPPAVAPEPSLQPDELNKRFGIPGRLTFTAPVPQSVAQGMYDAKRDELLREDAAARAPGGVLAGAARMGAGFIAGALDPVNAAAAFIPAIGEARMAGLLAKAGIPGLEGAIEGGAAALPGLAARAGLRAATGAAAGAIAQAPLSALRYGLAQQEQGDYGVGDALADIVMGGLTGGGLHTLTGGVGDIVGRAFANSRMRQIAEEDPAIREAAVRASIAAVSEDRAVHVGDVAPVVADAIGEGPVERAPALDATDQPTAATPAADPEPQRLLVQRMDERLEELRTIGASANFAAAPGVNRQTERPTFSAEPIAKAADKGLPARIVATALALKNGATNTRVLLADIHAKMPDVPLANFHAALEKLADGRDVGLIPMDDPTEITNRDRAVGINYGGQQRHILWLDTANPRGMEIAAPPRAPEQAAEEATVATQSTKLAAGQPNERLTAADDAIADAHRTDAGAGTDPTRKAADTAVSAAQQTAPVEQLAELEDFVRRARDSGALTADHEQVLTWLDEQQARSEAVTRAVAQAAACLARGII